MSARARRRALEWLAAGNAVLAPLKAGLGYGVFLRGDRRTRALVRLGEVDVRGLESEGALKAAPGGFVLSQAGLAMAARAAAAPGEEFLAQHSRMTGRSVAGAGAELRHVRAVSASTLLQRLGQLRSGDGAGWLNAEELRAAQVVREDWLAAQAGLTRSSDMTAPPLAGSRRARNGVEAAAVARCDARQRVGAALDALAPPLRRVVERVCILEEGIEAIERAESWPARSGKLALKLALSQLAVRLAG